ncbi:MAG: AzlC family ABC transporter permease [Anaerolineae bacterium]|nr:AzlC family ABC transporter permease [Anaerolineae bacterium]NUQ06950.1 AzlC family ABC transporter permease [Anaerolineae bacterium]
MTAGPRQEFIAGVRATLPLEIGAAPFGIIFGALAVTSGMSPAAAQGMSLFVFAGASQFIGVNLLAAGTALPVIVLTTFVVNLRHALYAATLAPHVRHLPQRWLAPLGFWLTDESFVVVANHYNEPGDPRHRHWFYLGSALLMYLNWQLWTLVGIIAGSAIPDPTRWGLDFAMIVTFIGMIIPTIKNHPMLAAVVTAGAVAALANPLPNKFGLILAALCGVAAGVIVEARRGEVKPETAP